MISNKGLFLLLNFEIKLYDSGVFQKTDVSMHEASQQQDKKDKRHGRRDPYISACLQLWNKTQIFNLETILKF